MFRRVLTKTPFACSSTNCEDDSNPDTPSMALDTPNRTAVYQVPATVAPPTVTSGKP